MDWLDLLLQSKEPKKVSDQLGQLQSLFLLQEWLFKDIFYLKHSIFLNNEVPFTYLIRTTWWPFKVTNINIKNLGQLCLVVSILGDYTICRTSVFCFLKCRNQLIMPCFIYIKKSLLSYFHYRSLMVVLESWMNWRDYIWMSHTLSKITWPKDNCNFPSSLPLPPIPLKLPSQQYYWSSQQVD